MTKMTVRLKKTEIAATEVIIDDECRSIRSFVDAQSTVFDRKEMLQMAEDSFVNDAEAVGSEG